AVPVPRDPPRRSGTASRGRPPGLRTSISGPRCFPPRSWETSAGWRGRPFEPEVHVLVRLFGSRDQNAVAPRLGGGLSRPLRHADGAEPEGPGRNVQDVIPRSFPLDD